MKYFQDKHFKVLCFSPNNILRRYKHLPDQMLQKNLILNFKKKNEKNMQLDEGKDSN